MRFVWLRILGVGGDPVDVGGGPAVDSRVSGLGAAVAPRDDTAVNLARAASEGAARVTLLLK